MARSFATVFGAVCGVLSCVTYFGSWILEGAPNYAASTHLLASGIFCILVGRER